MEQDIDYYINISYFLLRRDQHEWHDIVVDHKLKIIKHIAKKYCKNIDAANYFQLLKDDMIDKAFDAGDLELIRRINLVEKNEKEN